MCSNAERARDILENGFDIMQTPQNLVWRSSAPRAELTPRPRPLFGLSRLAAGHQQKISVLWKIFAALTGWTGGATR